MYICSGSNIDVVGYEMTRPKVALMYVLLDAVQVVIVMIFMLFMRSFVRREIEDVERSLVEVQDFTVRIQNMPSLKQF